MPVNPRFEKKARSWIYGWTTYSVASTPYSLEVTSSDSSIDAISKAWEEFLWSSIPDM